MTQQIAFEFLPLVVPEQTGMTIEERFRIFHEHNPHVYRLLRAMALEWKRTGNHRCGMKMLWEALRYNSGLQTQGEPYKLNNNYTALYARLLMAEEPELRGMFETRERRAD